MEKVCALTKAISLTDEILLLLDQQNFDAVDTLEAKRQPLIERAFSGVIEDIDQVKALHLKELNDRVVSKLIEMKNSVLSSQQQLRHAVKATKAYTDIDSQS